MDDKDKPLPDGYVRIVTVGIGATVSTAIIHALANSSFVSAEVDPVQKSNIFETKYNRQREWWNTPKKERRRKK
jgi:hypothetical protein